MINIIKSYNNLKHKIEQLKQNTRLEKVYKISHKDYKL